MNKTAVFGRKVMPRTHIDWLKHYAPETEKKFRNLAVKEDETLKKLKDAYRKLEYQGDGEEYNTAVSLIYCIKYSSEDVTNFSIALAEFQEDGFYNYRAGLLLSALVNESKEDNFMIITEHLGQRIDKLGHHNKKNLVIQGNTGGSVGEWMESGTVTVQGDVGRWVGINMKDGRITIQGNAGYGVGCSMEAGKIIVKGNAGADVGRYMKGGTIIVKGNAGDNVGFEMEGGKIHLEGKYGSFYGPKRGEIPRIYHKGRLIVKDGKRL